MLLKTSWFTTIGVIYVMLSTHCRPIDCVQFEMGTCLFQYLEPCAQKFINFYVFSSDMPNEGPVRIDPDNITWPDGIDLRKTNKMIIHGYGGNWDFYATKKIRKEYLRNRDTNVFVVDWGKLAQLPCYPSAAVNTKQAGECTAIFLLKLRAFYGREFMVRNMHAVGFSLGAHVAAFASNALERHVNQRFDRITGENFDICGCVLRESDNDYWHFRLQAWIQHFRSLRHRVWHGNWIVAMPISLILFTRMLACLGKSSHPAIWISIWTAAPCNQRASITKVRGRTTLDHNFIDIHWLSC